MDVTQQQYELINFDAELENDNEPLRTASASIFSETIQKDPRKLQTRRKPPPSRLRRQWFWRFKKSWRFGLFVGLYSSLTVFAGNVALLLLGAVLHGGFVDGIGTLVEGDSAWTSRVGAGLHVLINVMSTILLTSSNYAMQLLCAPTRTEIDDAHRNGQWLEIALLSFRNLKYINKKRAVLWWLLAVSSVPLHLFYNSAIFGVISGQDYQITVIKVDQEMTLTTSSWKTLNNSEWTKIYSDDYVSGYSDLLLVIDQAASEMVVQSNWTMSFRPVTIDACNASVPLNDNLTFPVVLDLNSSSVRPRPNSSMRVAYDLEQAGKYSFDVDKLWPKFTQINVPQQYHDQLELCSSEGWLLKPRAGLRTKYAHAKVSPHGNKVQIGLPFLIIVIITNSVKVVCLYYTLKICSSGHIVTVGDAVSSFLHKPDSITKGKCVQSQRQILGAVSRAGPQAWRQEKKRFSSVIGGKRIWTVANLMAPVLLVTLFSALALSRSDLATSPGWGTASKLTIPATQISFDSRSAILTAWLANLPQVLLSLFYFSINRICTSISFAREWNHGAIKRRGLRVTCPEGAQRSTYFLQLPTHFAAPLTIASGLLHWLLSQSLFLVRLEARNRDGQLYPSSTCACGYSVWSLLTFTIVAFILVAIVVIILMWQIDVRIPPARHCSLIISAACHPRSDDVDSHLKAIQWGVVEEGTKNMAGHCTFTSHDVQAPQEGYLYA